MSGGNTPTYIDYLVHLLYPVCVEEKDLVGVVNTAVWVACDNSQGVLIYLRLLTS